MSIKTRRIICIIFILIFFIATPLIIAYATGYKLSFNKKFLQKTGIFILDSHPSGAKIFINNKIQQNLFKKIFLNKQTYITTPAKIKNLSPGEYVVRLELTDYWPWGKKLSIKPGLATYAEDIYLFKQNLPVLAISTKINDLKLSPAKNKLAILNSNQLILFNLINETKQITPLLNKKKSLSWSNNNQKIILDNTAYDVDNLDNKITIDDLAIKNPTKLSWTDNKLYYTSVDSLSYFDPMNKSSEEIINKKEINDYVIKNNYLYLLNNFNSLNILKIDTIETIGNISLPNATNYSFINTEQKIINIYDQNHQILYLIDSSTSSRMPIIKKINNIKYTYWINDAKLLYANDFEIWLYNIVSEEKNLITRISNNITGIVWHPSNNYLIYSTEKTINSIELDKREKQNITELVKFDKISSLFINPKGDLLYFSAKINNQEGIYKLTIQ